MRPKSLTWLMHLDDFVPNETQERFRGSQGSQDPHFVQLGEVQNEAQIIDLVNVFGRLCAK